MAIPFVDRTAELERLRRALTGPERGTRRITCAVWVLRPPRRLRVPGVIRAEQVPGPRP